MSDFENQQQLDEWLAQVDRYLQGLTLEVPPRLPELSQTGDAAALGRQVVELTKTVNSLIDAIGGVGEAPEKAQGANVSDAFSLIERQLRPLRNIIGGGGTVVESTSLGVSIVSKTHDEGPSVMPERRRWLRVIDGTGPAPERQFYRSWEPRPTPYGQTYIYAHVSDVGIGWYVDECDAFGDVFFPSMTRDRDNVWIKTIAVNTRERRVFDPIHPERVSSLDAITDAQFWPVSVTSFSRNKGPIVEWLGTYEVTDDAHPAGQCNYVRVWEPPLVSQATVTAVSGEGYVTEATWDLESNLKVIGSVSTASAIEKSFYSLSDASDRLGPPAEVGDGIFLLPALVAGVLHWIDTTPRLPGFLYSTAGADDEAAVKWITDVGRFWAQGGDLHPAEHGH